MTFRREGRLTDMTDLSTAMGRHRRELHVHCYRMLGSFEEAEDLVQETFLRAWRGRATLRRRRGLRAWLYKIATNACLDALAQQAPRAGRALVRPRCRGCSRTRTGCSTRSRRPRRSRTPSSSRARRSSWPSSPLIQSLPARQRAVLILRDVLELVGAGDRRRCSRSSVAAANSALQRARATIARRSCRAARDGAAPS